MAWAKKQRGKHIVPILVEDVVDDPDFFPFVRIQGIKFHGVDYGIAFARLLAALPSPAGDAATVESLAQDPGHKRNDTSIETVDYLREEAERVLHEPSESIRAEALPQSRWQFGFAGIPPPVGPMVSPAPLPPASSTKRRAAGGTPVALDGRVWGAVFVVALVTLSIGVAIHNHGPRSPASSFRLASVATPLPGKTNSVDGAEMVYIPAGTFTMGDNNPPSGDNDEKPAHSVYLDGYYIYKNDVTVAEYEKFCDATGRKMPDAPSWGWNDSSYPMVNVSWYDATAYAKWAGASLPTEAQWEKAARGTDGRVYPWGNQWDASKCANSVGVTRSSPAPVGSFPDGASPYGVLDMAGNVWQWCSDWYAADYYGTSPAANPPGPAGGEYRVLRGGGWDLDNEDNFRCACRFRLDPENWDDYIGFRCAFRPGSP